jgi:hypothetical protein
MQEHAFERDPGLLTDSDLVNTPYAVFLFSSAAAFHRLTQRLFVSRRRRAIS